MLRVWLRVTRSNERTLFVSAHWLPVEATWAECVFGTGTLCRYVGFVTVCITRLTGFKPGWRMFNSCHADKGCSYVHILIDSARELWSLVKWKRTSWDEKYPRDLLVDLVQTRYVDNYLWVTNITRGTSLKSCSLRFSRLLVENLFYLLGRISALSCNSMSVYLYIHSLNHG